MRVLHALQKCSTHYIRRDELEPAVLSQLRADCAFAREHEDEFVKMVEKKTRRQGEDAVRQGEKEYAEAKARLEEIDRIINQLYEDKVSGHICLKCIRMILSNCNYLRIIFCYGSVIIATTHVYLELWVYLREYVQSLLL